MDDFDDLIGGTPAPPRKKKLITSGANNGKDVGLSLDIGDVTAGVTVTWIANIFHMGVGTVRRKLANCPKLQNYKGGELYDLKIAVQYLVKPAVDISTFIKNMRPGDLPPMLQKDYWDAMLKRQRWEEEAGELWRTDQVLEVLGEAFKTVKMTIQLWPENLERVHGLSDQQRAALLQCTDGLLEDLNKALVEMPKLRATGNVRAEHDAEPIEGVLE